MASVNSHTGSVTVKNRTNNGSDVVLGDRRQFKTQRSDPLKTWSYVVSVSCFGVRFSVMFHFMFVHYTLVQFGLLSGHLLGNSCPLG